MAPKKPKAAKAAKQKKSKAAKKSAAPKTNSKRQPDTEASRREMISRANFDALARRCTHLQSDISEKSGTMGEQIKNAADTQHLHRGAFALWRKLNKMSGNKIAEYLAHFDYYRKIATKIGNQEIPSLDDRATEQGQMFERTEAGEGGDGDGETETSPGTPAGETDQRPRFAVHDGGGQATGTDG